MFWQFFFSKFSYKKFTPKYRQINYFNYFLAVNLIFLVTPEKVLLSFPRFISHTFFIKLLFPSSPLKKINSLKT